MTTRIAFIGAAGSGKTTLASDIFQTLKSRGLNTEHLHEWIRYDIHRHGPMKSIWEQYRTYNHQRRLEDAVPASVEFTVVDSGTLTPYFYAVLYADQTDPRQRLVLQDMYGYLLDDLYLGRYDLVFFLPMLAHHSRDDGTRYQHQADVTSLDMHMSLVFEHLHRTGNVHRVDGPFEARRDQVMTIITQTYPERLAPIASSKVASEPRILV